MVTLSELETEARIFDHQADAFIMIARALKGRARASAEGHALGLREAAAAIRRLEDRTINDAAEWDAGQTFTGDEPYFEHPDPDEAADRSVFQ